MKKLWVLLAVMISCMMFSVGVSAVDGEGDQVRTSNTLYVDELDGKDASEVIVGKNNITFVWDKLSEDAYYYFRIVPDVPDKDTIAQKNYYQNSYTLSSSELIPGYSYRVILQRYNSAGTRISGGTRDFEFVVSGAESILMEKIEISTPITNQTYAYDDLTVTWSDLNYAVSYELFLEYNCGKKYHEIMTVSLDASVHSYTIPTEVLQRGCPHRVYVTAKDKLGNELEVKESFVIEGDVASSQLIKPVITAPYFTDLYFPYGNIKTVPVYDDVTVTWEKVPAAVKYAVTLKTDGGDTISLPNAEQITNTQYTIPVECMTSGTVYEVDIKAYHNINYDCYAKSSTYYFRAPYKGNLVLDAPILTSHDFSTDSNDPTQFIIQKMDLEWTRVSAAEEYRVSLVSMEDPDFKLTYKNLTDNTLSIPYRDIYEMFDNGEVIEVEIRADDSKDGLTFTSYFIELTEIPIDKPVIISPVLAVAESGVLPSFEAEESVQLAWNAVDTATSYRIYLLEYYNGEWDEISRWDGIVDTTFSIPEQYLYDFGKFAVKIAAYNSYGKSSGATRYYFRIGTDNGIQLTAPSKKIISWEPSYEANHKYINVNTAGDWFAVVSAPWLSVDLLSGSGCASLKIDITKNDDVFARTGYVTVTNSYGESAVFTVIQAADGSSNEGALVISYPSQGDTIEKKDFSTRWSYRYGYAYFNTELKNLSTNQIIYTDKVNLVPVSRIPGSALNVGDMYLLTVYVYNYSEVCVDQSSVTFKVDGGMWAETPIVTALEVSPTSGNISDTYTFTAKATGTDKVAFYVDTYHLATVTGTNGVFTYSHNAFTSTGNRTAYAYPCDANGNPIMTEGSFASAAFIIAEAPKLDPVTVTSPKYSSGLVNCAFAMSWVAPTNAPAGTRYNIYVYRDGNKVGEVITTTALSCIVPASYFTEEGEYMVEVLAAASGWEASRGSYAQISVNTAQAVLTDYSLDRTTVALGGTVSLSGWVNGNGGTIAKLSVTVLNTDKNEGGTYISYTPNTSIFDLSSIPALNTSGEVFRGAGNYKIRVFVLMQGASDAELVGSASLSVLSDARSSLAMPVVTGSASVIAGDDYPLSWIPVANADYYELTIDGASYREIIRGNTATIPGKTIKNLTGTQTATTLKLRLTAHSSDTDTWLPSSAAVKTVTVMPEVQSRAMIHGVSMNNYTVVAGTAAQFTVITTTDVTAIRMKEGAGSYIINTWTTGYVDRNGERIWTVSQQINDPGVNNQRVLTFYSMIGNTEYNKCDIGFSCVVTAAIGSFDIVSPAHESKQADKHDLSITWNAPANVAVDSYIVRVYHGDECILQQDAPAQNPAPVVIPGALLQRDNKAYQVRITARKTGYAESTAVSRFTLLCPHDNLYQPVETMKYTSVSAWVHMVDITSTYTCADCGQKNVKNETKTTSQGHTWVNLDNGGRVCNLCWYMEGIVEDTKEYKFIGSSQNRTVYMNVDASGEPYGVQKNDAGVVRQVFETDVITVLGTKGACYLIRYPVGQSGYHFGFMKQEMVEQTNNDPEPEYKTLNQMLVEEFIQSAYDTSFSPFNQPFLNEFSTADRIAEEVLSKNGLEWATLQFFNDGFLKSFEWYFGPGRDASKLYNDRFYSVLREAMLCIPTISDEKIEKLISDIELENIDSVYKGICDFSGFADVKQMKFFQGNIVDTYSKYAETLGKNTLEFLKEAGNSKAEIMEGIADKGINILADPAIQCIIDVFDFMVLRQLMTELYFEILVDICGEDERPAIEQLQMQLKDARADIKNFGENLKNKILQEGAEFSLKTVIPPSNSILAIIKGADIIRAILMKTTGLSGVADGENALVLGYPVLDAARKELMWYIYNYIQSDYSNVLLADKIVTAYDIVRGLQIYINQNAVLCTNQGDDIIIMQTEIAHLKNTPIDMWVNNPYNISNDILMPDLTQLDNYSMGQYYKRLMGGYENFWIKYAGAFGNWDKMNTREKSYAVVQFNRLTMFARYPVTKMHFIELGKDTYSNGKHRYYETDRVAVLFENSQGEGLLLNYIDGGRLCLGISLLTENQVNELFSSKSAELPRRYLLVHETEVAHTLADTDRFYFIVDECEYLRVIRNSTSCEHSVVNRYFSRNVDQAQYEEMLDAVTSNNVTAEVNGNILIGWQNMIKESIDGTFWMGASFDQFAQYLVGKEAIVEVRKP